MGMTKSARALMHARALEKPLDIMVAFQSVMDGAPIPDAPTVQQNLTALMQVADYLGEHPELNPSRQHDPRLANHIGCSAYSLLVEVDRTCDRLDRPAHLIQWRGEAA
jgi:hypothetical protein